MKAIFYPRESVITATSTSYNLVVLDAVNDLYDKEGDKPLLRRNPNLNAQLEAVKKWGIPILFRIVINAQWYSDGVQQGLHDPTSWKYWMDKWLLDDVSAVLQNPARAHGFLVTAVPVESAAVTTTSTWVKETMANAANLIYGKRALPVWLEFTSLMMNTAWDKGTAKYGQMQAFLETKEWVDRGQKDPMLDQKELTFPDNTLSYLPVITKPEIPQEIPNNPEIPEDISVEDQYVAALMKLPDILTEAKRTNVLLESVYKLLEAVLWRKQ